MDSNYTSPDCLAFCPVLFFPHKIYEPTVSASDDVSGKRINGSCETISRTKLTRSSIDSSEKSRFSRFYAIICSSLIIIISQVGLEVKFRGSKI